LLTFLGKCRAMTSGPPAAVMMSVTFRIPPYVGFKIQMQEGSEFQHGIIFSRYVPRMDSKAIEPWAERLREVFDEKGWTMRELSSRSGVSYDSVNKYLRGDVKQPRGNTLDKLASALQTSSLYLREGLHPGPRVSTNQIPVRGEVAAGVWLEVSAIDDEPIRWLPFNPAPEYVEGALYSLIVRGDSVDKIAPDGCTLIVLDLGLSGVSLKDGDLAIVERRMHQDGLREVTAKRVRQMDGELHLIPESTNPKWQTAKFRLADCDGDVEMRAIARVEYILQKP
jgi:transcriptional regulator with XRE-family HTH domain